MEKNSKKHWALERQRQEALTMRDRRYRRNAATIATIVVLILDLFAGSGSMLNEAVQLVGPATVPVLQAPDPPAPSCPPRSWIKVGLRATWG